MPKLAKRAFGVWADVFSGELFVAFDPKSCWPAGLFGLNRSRVCLSFGSSTDFDPNRLLLWPFSWLLGLKRFGVDSAGLPKPVKGVAGAGVPGGLAKIFDVLEAVGVESVGLKPPKSELLEVDGVDSAGLGLPNNELLGAVGADSEGLTPPKKEVFEEDGVVSAGLTPPKNEVLEAAGVASAGLAAPKSGVLEAVAGGNDELTLPNKLVVVVGADVVGNEAEVLPNKFVVLGAAEVAGKDEVKEEDGADVVAVVLPNKL